MIIYFSGGGVKGVWQEVNERLINYKASRLLSFAYKKLLLDFCELIRSVNKPCDLLVDSGAFTAWSKGEEVIKEDLAACFDTIQQGYGDLLNLHLINLDRIPGRKGVDPTEQQILDAMDESMSNFDYLNNLFPGKVLPVFHQGEPQAYLDTMKKLSDYICLSPRNDVAEKQRVRWSQEAHDEKHMYHGLATTGVNMMETVNWFSVDSAGWVMIGGMGSIMFEINGALKPVAISDTSPSLKVKGKHIETMIEKDFIVATIEAKGYDYKELQSNDRQRYIWNMERMKDYQDAYKPRHHYERGLFDL